MDQYDIFSRYYDQTLGQRKERVANLLRNLLEQHGAEKGSLLEIACGTGNILGELKDDFDEVEGLDLSPAMVEIAQNKFPDITVLEADMTTFDLGKEFDVTICIFDSINHLLKEEQWQQSIERAAAHTKPGGTFIVDVNADYLYETSANKDPYVSSFGKYDEHVLIESGTQREPKSIEWEFSYFIEAEDGRYDRHNIIVPEITFSQPDIEEMLRGHFSTVDAYNQNGEVVTPETLRWYFVCKK